VDRRHLNGVVATVVADDSKDCAENENDSKLLQLPDGSRIRLRPRNFSLLERAPPPPTVDTFGLCGDELVSASNIAKQKAQSLIKNKLTSSSRSSGEAAADDASVKLLQSCIAAQSQAPLDENNAAALLGAICRSSSWAIVEALVPSYLASVFVLPQQELRVVLDFVMAGAPQVLCGVLKAWGRSATEMPIIPLACIKVAAQAFKTWSDNRPVWPALASDEARSAAELFCSSTRAVQPLLAFDAENTLFASHVMCLYTTVVCEEAAAFSGHLKLQQPAHSAGSSSCPPPHVDAWRNDPLHSALNLIAHALSLMHAFPKCFSAIRLPHPVCFCPLLSSVTNFNSGVIGIRTYKDCRWEHCLWQLMFDCIGAVELPELHRLHHKLCSDRAIILSRCIARTMRMLHHSAACFSDANYRLAAVQPLLERGLRLSWGEHYRVVTACCDISSEVLTLASSLYPSLSPGSVVDVLTSATALAVAEPEQNELIRSVESNVNAASRLLHASSDSIFYQMLGKSGCKISCETQFDANKRDVQRHVMSLSASLVQSPGQTSVLSPSPTCGHHGHTLRISALACLRALLLRHTSTSAHIVPSLRSAYR
jgi:hypothetical protein